MSGKDLRSRLGRAIRNPGAIPGRLKRRLEAAFGSVESAQVVWPEPGRAQLQTVRLPPPRGNEVLVRHHLTVISPGTERAQFAGRPNASVAFPYHAGYSGSGIVIEVGDNVRTISPGARVAGPLAHAASSLVSADQLALVPERVSDTQAAFSHLALIAAHGLRAGSFRAAESAVVIGGGLIGQLLIQLLAAAGAYPITVLLRSGRRSALCRDHGAHDVRIIDPTEPVAVDADVTFDTTGNPEAVHVALRCTRRGGRIVLVGSNRGETKELDLQRLRDAGLTLIGAHITNLAQPATRELAGILALLRDGRLRVDQLVTHEVDPAEAELFYRRLAAGNEEILGAVFRWDRTPLPPVGAPPPVPPTSAPLRTPSRVATVRSLRIGLIGCGEIGLENARAVHEAADASLAMVADIDRALAADLAGRYGVPSANDADHLLERSDVDAVLISTPHALHAPLAIRAAQCGKHVVVEKPMATSLGEADAIIDACSRAGVQLSVLYCQRYLPYAQKAKSLIESGSLGELLGFHLLHYLDRPLSYWSGGRTGRVASDWRLSRAQSGGGIVVFNLVHLFDLLRYLTGMEATSVHADLQRHESPADTEDTVSITLRYDHRLTGNVSAATCVRGANLGHQQLRIWGTEGHLVVGEPFRFYSLHQFESHAPGQWHTLADWEWGKERRTFIERFAAAVLRGDAPEVGAADGRAVQLLTDAIYRSGETHETVNLGDP